MRGDERISSCHQWCELHGCHQDDPKHDYQYPACEQHLRPSTTLEEIRLRLRWLTNGT